MSQIREGSMKKTIGIIPACALTGAALLVGAGGMWALQLRAQLHGLPALSLAHELETTGLCANGLTLHAIGDRDRLARLLEQRLDSAMGQASALTEQGIRLNGAAPNLRDGVRRAAAYYSASGNAKGQRQAEALLAALTATDE